MQKRKKDLIEILYDNRKLLIPVAILILALIIAIIVINWPKPEEVGAEEPVTTMITLFGSETINLKVGENFEEPGYYAIDSKGVIQTNQVTVTNNIDINTPGTYTVTYQIAETTAKRIVIVEGSTESNKETNTKLTLTLKGEKVITLNLNDDYLEPGYIATNLEGKDISNQVLVNGIVNMGKSGTYTLTYIIQENGLKEEAQRTIIVN